MPDAASAELIPLVSHEQVENAFWKALRMFVGRGKRHSADEVSKGAGVHRRTLDCYRGYAIGHTDHRPLDQGQKFSIASYVGADLTSEWIRFIGQGAFDLPDIDGDGPGIGDLAVEESEDSAKVVRMAMDGKVDAAERPDAAAVGNRMMSRGARLAAMGRS